MSLSLYRKNGNVVLKDDKGRILMNGEGVNIAIARFPDLDETTKDYMAKLYSSLTGAEYSEARDFLDYKSEGSEFCS